ncbi:MAG: hypothetical protein LCH91_26430 [Bacteroidetes bacterium]|nr:hypothetical protein [Bacteroidota bacterium]
MLNEHIEDNEFLYRRIILNPNFWDFEKNRPSSAIFKDSNGASVDRQDNRSDSDVIETYKNYEIRGITKVLTSVCRELETYPIYKPLDDNIYHCEIHDSKEKIQLSSSKAKKLRDNSIVIFTKDV